MITDSDPTWFTEICKESGSAISFQIREKLHHAAIFDGRNLYDPQVVNRAGLAHYSIGRRAARVD